MSTDSVGILEPAALPEWAEILVDARNTSGPGLVALCRLLLDDDVDAPPALREIATRFVEARLYRVDRPRAREGDPSTSAAAAEKVRAGLYRPGGTVHRILEAYAECERLHPAEGGRTAREIEFPARVKAAHKRTSELLADGLLRVSTYGIGHAQEGEEIVRGGGRVLSITADGRAELARLNAAAARKAAAERVKRERAEARLRRRGVRADGRPTVDPAVAERVRRDNDRRIGRST